MQAAPAGGAARKQTGHVTLLLKTPTVALLLRAHVEPALQMGGSGAENRKKKNAAWTRGPSV